MQRKWVRPQGQPPKRMGPPGLVPRSQSGQQCHEHSGDSRVLSTCGTGAASGLRMWRRSWAIGRRPGEAWEGDGAPSRGEACGRVRGPEKGRPVPLLPLRSGTDVKAPQAFGSEAICSAFIHHNCILSIRYM